jgi:glycosyltransferase involved in cell wall biosynthesis
MQRREVENVRAYTITAIVPCRNERESIERCVHSILGQELCDRGIEVIVVDGLSDDGTPAILNRLALEYPSLKVLTNPKRTMPAGVNIGIQAARGRYIAIMGAHNRYAPDYLRQSVQVLEETNADNVGGGMICEGRSHVQRAIALAHHSKFSVGGASWHNPNYEGPADTVFGGVYRREVFEQIGLFDEELVRNQDDEFNLRLIQRGGRIWHSPRIRSWYSPRQKLTALFRQYVQYGYWRVRVIQKRKAVVLPRQFVPGMFVFLLLVLPLVGRWWRVAGWAWVALVLSCLACSVLVSVTIADREGWRFLCTLPVVFACYRIGYGVGTLRGVVDFVLLKRAPVQFYSQLTRSSSSCDHLDAP